MTALIRFFARHAAAYFSMISVSSTPVGISYTPGLVHMSADADENRAGMFWRADLRVGLPSERRMTGTLAIVSTLLIVVGQPQRPFCAGNGGFTRGYPRSPSIEFISDDSSPQMYAPLPGG